MELNYLSITRLKRANRCSLGMEKWFHTTFYWEFDHSSMLRFKFKMSTEISWNLLALNVNKGDFEWCILLGGYFQVIFSFWPRHRQPLSHKTMWYVYMHSKHFRTHKMHWKYSSLAPNHRYMICMYRSVSLLLILWREMPTVYSSLFIIFLIVCICCVVLYRLQ